MTTDPGIEILKQSLPAKCWTQDADIIAPHLSEFVERYPDVSIDLTLTDHFVDVIESGADVVVRVGGLSDSSLIARRLAPTRRVLVASRAYLDRFGAPRGDRR